MAFDTNTSTTGRANDDSWKAQAFLNIYLPKADGKGKNKVGAIPLKVSRKFEAALIKRLSEDPTALQAMQTKLVIDFQLVDDPAAKPAELPF